MNNPDRIWVMSDYVQAEIMVAAWFGPIPLMKEWFKTNQDIHLNVAKLIGQQVEKHKIKLPNKAWNRKPWQELDANEPLDHDIERDLAKRTVHANTNGMWRTRFARITGLPVFIAGQVQDIYHGLFPEIRGSYHVGIQQQVAINGTLTNPLGWSRTFYNVNPLSGQYEEDEFRVMYAWIPQSTIGMLTIRAYLLHCEQFAAELPEATIKLWTPQNILARGYDVQLQVHDMLAVSTPNDSTLIRNTAQAMREASRYTMMINDDSLVIPVDFKVGPSWGDMKKYVLEDNDEYYGRSK